MRTGSVLLYRIQTNSTICVRQKAYGILPPCSWLDEVFFHSDDTKEIPAGYMTVLVTLIINGSPPIATKLLAGSVGVEIIPEVQRAASVADQKVESPPATLAPRVKTRYGFPYLASKLLRLCGGKYMIEKKAKKGIATNEVEVDREDTPPGPVLNTLRAATGWWMYYDLKPASNRYILEQVSTRLW